MKSPITNPPALRDSGTKNSARPRAAAMSVIAIVLLGIAGVGTSLGAASPVQFRPIQDFIEAQGTLDFIPVEFHGTGWFDGKTVRFAHVDCMGRVNEWLKEQSGGAMSLGTEIEGKITEQLLPDGRAQVTVSLRTRNALTWVAEFVPENTPPVGQMLFGHLAAEVLEGAEPALGESLFNWVFINEAPGAPLPDLLAQVVLGPTVETLMISIEARADGSFREASGEPEGAPGRTQITQIGRLFAPGLDATLTTGKWPAEHINLKAVGR